ncbi:MAG TPA: hypothetical protein VHS55_02200, partial [Solirubrobacteraceae bacterium]|nr:hypothetical protein [Solirubrobacteraceae bacterium]
MTSLGHDTISAGAGPVDDHYQASWRPQALWAQALCVGVLGSLALAILSLLSRREPTPRGDDLIYERMAQHPFATHTFPFAYRVGLPWLVHVLPFSHTTSFLLLAWLAAGGAAAFAFALMRRLGAPAAVAAPLAFALAVSPPLLIVALRDGRNPDAVTILFMMAATLLAVQRRPRALAVTLLVGVLFREAVLFVIPLAYAVWAAKLWDRDVAVRVLVAGAPAVAAYVALHLAIPTVGRSSVPGYSGSLVGERGHVIALGLESLATELRRMFSVFGPLWLLAPLALRGSRFARRGLALVACSLVSMTFALDWGRMIFLSAPVFYPAGAFTLTARPRWRIPSWIAFAAL